MKKLKIIAIANILLGVSFFITALTSLIIVFELPARWAYELHIPAGITMIILGFLHVAFHLKQSLAITKAAFKK